jgi:S1-C subfamily serine protease
MAEDGIGAGALLSQTGELITNEHVVRSAHRRDGAEWVAVWFKTSATSTRVPKDGYLLARVTAKDVRSDLAVVQLVQAPPPTATPIPLAAALPDVGQDVFAIGHPVGLLWSFTQGIVSQIRQNHEWTYADAVPRRATVIQTQTPTVSGSSGGPLLNDEGQIVGIIMAGAVAAQGFNFAVSVHHARQLSGR